MRRADRPRLDVDDVVRLGHGPAAQVDRELVDAWLGLGFGLGLRLGLGLGLRVRVRDRVRVPVRVRVRVRVSVHVPCERLEVDGAQHRAVVLHHADERRAHALERRAHGVA